MIYESAQQRSQGSYQQTANLVASWHFGRGRFSSNRGDHRLCGATEQADGPVSTTTTQEAQAAMQLTQGLASGTLQGGG